MKENPTYYRIQLVDRKFEVVEYKIEYHGMNKYIAWPKDWTRFEARQVHEDELKRYFGSTPKQALDLAIDDIACKRNRAARELKESEKYLEMLTGFEVAE